MAYIYLVFSTKDYLYVDFIYPKIIIFPAVKFRIGAYNLL